MWLESSKNAEKSNIGAQRLGTAGLKRAFKGYQEEVGNALHSCRRSSEERI